MTTMLPLCVRAESKEPVFKLCSKDHSIPCADKEPKALHTVAPNYSNEARKNHIEGTIVLWIVVGSNGQMSDIRVARPLGYGLEDEAIKAVKKWKFAPATCQGTPCAVMVNVEVTFRLGAGR